MPQEGEHGTTEHENEGTEGAGTGNEQGEEQQGNEPKQFSETYVRQLRGEAGDYRRRLREAEDKLKTFEDAGKSELEKLTERVTQAEAGLAGASAEAARLRVAMKHGLTEVQAKRLVGNTLEELEADAAELLKAFGAEDGDDDEGQGPSGGTPRERLKPGAVPAAEPDEMDPAKLAEQIRRPYQ